MCIFDGVDVYTDELSQLFEAIMTLMNGYVQKNVKFLWSSKGDSPLALKQWPTAEEDASIFTINTEEASNLYAINREVDFRMDIKLKRNAYYIDQHVNLLNRLQSVHSRNHLWLSLTMDIIRRPSKENQEGSCAMEDTLHDS